MSDKKLVNGNSQQSHVIAHLTSYPVVSDGISFYKSNPYGQKSLTLADDLFNRLAVPFLPYLKGPYSWVAPYVAKADELGDNGLSRVDKTFPIVKEDTETIKGTILDYALFPLRLIGESKNYVFRTYDDESGKVQGTGVVKTAKTVVSTELRIISDGLHYVAEFVGPRKEKAEKVVKEKLDAFKKQSHQTQQHAHEKTKEASEKVQKK